MGKKGQNFENLSKRRKKKIATFLLFFYLIGNLTVLEYFGGNPELGIVSFRQVSEKSQTTTSSSPHSFADDSQSSRQGNNSDIELDGDDCLATCTHSIVGFPVIENRHPIMELQVSSTTVKHVVPDPHLTSFYRPPRTA